MRKIMICLGAMLVAQTGKTAFHLSAADALAATPRVWPAKAVLDKTWTLRGQEKQAGSQVLVSKSLTSQSSFQAEGTRFELATQLPGHHISSSTIRMSIVVYSALRRTRVRSYATGSFHSVSSFRQCPGVWLQIGYIELRQLW
jgi:hypothetical protein